MLDIDTLRPRRTATCCESGAQAPTTGRSGSPTPWTRSQAESSYDKGVLTVRFAKQEAKKARRLEIKVK